MLQTTLCEFCLLVRVHVEVHGSSGFIVLILQVF